MQDLMKDSYANYFCRSFYFALEKSDRLKFLQYIKHCAVIIAMNKIGTYPLQNIIENLKTKEEKMLVVEIFKNDVLELAYVNYYK